MALAPLRALRAVTVREARERGETTEAVRDAVVG